MFDEKLKDLTTNKTWDEMFDEKLKDFTTNKSLDEKLDEKLAPLKFGVSSLAWSVRNRPLISWSSGQVPFPLLSANEFTEWFLRYPSLAPHAKRFEGCTAMDLILMSEADMIRRGVIEAMDRKMLMAAVLSASKEFKY